MSILRPCRDLGRIVRCAIWPSCFLHLLATVARLAGPGGARSVVAESVLVKHQLLILNRSRKRSPNLRPSDRVVAGLCALFMRPGRLIRSAIVFKPSTLLSLHRALIQRKYRRLFSSKGPMKPGPKGPSQDVIAAVVDMKQRNPSWGCPRIAQQITLAFGIPINKDVVRRILAARYQPKPDSAGPSWLTVLGHAKDSLWSLDLFRCESAILHTHWVLVVMDQCTRRIVGFGVHRGVVIGNSPPTGHPLVPVLSTVSLARGYRPAVRRVNRSEVLVEPIQDFSDEIGTSQEVGVTAVVLSEHLVGFRRAERLEQRLLVRLHREDEVVAAVQHQHRDVHAGCEVPGVDFRRIAVTEPAGRQHGGLETRIDGDQPSTFRGAQCSRHRSPTCWCRCQVWSPDSRWIGPNPSTTSALVLASEWAAGGDGEGPLSSEPL